MFALDLYKLDDACIQDDLAISMTFLFLDLNDNSL